MSEIKNSPEERSLDKPRWLSDALLIGSVTFIGYCFTYWFERGIGSVLGYPEYLIELSLTEILFTVMSLATVMILIAQIVNVINKRVTSTHPHIRRRHLSTIIFAVLIFVIALFFGFRHFKEWGIAIYVFSLYAYFTYLHPLISHWGQGNVEDKYSAHDKSRSTSYVDWISAHFGYFTSVALTFVLLGSVLSYYIGKSNAYDQNQYLLSIADNTVILRHYGDVYLTKRYDKSTQRIVGPLRILRAEDLANLQFEYVHLGEKTYKKLPGARVVIAYTSIIDE